MSLHMDHAILGGFIATLLLTITLMASVGLGFTRMDLPFMVGAAFTANRDKAKWIGFILNFIAGWIFALVYITVIQDTGMYHWWFGMLMGLIHALFLLLVVMEVLPTVHPRMATEQRGPDPTRQLEPPGFMGLHYGRGTPITTIAAHLVYGATLGLFYR